MFKSLSKQLMNSVQHLIVRCVFYRLDNTVKDISYSLDARELEVSRKAAISTSRSNPLFSARNGTMKIFSVPVA